MVVVWMAAWYLIVLGGRPLVASAAIAVVGVLCIRGIRFEHDWAEFIARNRVEAGEARFPPADAPLETVTTGLSLLALAVGVLAAHRLALTDGISGWGAALLALIGLWTWRIGPHRVMPCTWHRRWLAAIYATYLAVATTWMFGIHIAAAWHDRLVGRVSAFVLLGLFAVGLWRGSTTVPEETSDTRGNVREQPLMHLLGVSDRARLTRADASNQLARDLIQQGLWQKACEVAETAYDEFRFNSAKTRELRTARAAILGNLGCIHSHLGHWSQAEAFLKQSLDENRQLHGERSPQLVIDLTNLADFYVQVSFHDAARTSYDEAARISQELADRPLYADALAGLADLDYAVGDLASAERRCREALAIRVDHFTQDHPACADAFRALGTVLWARGEIATAGQHLHDALAIRERHVGRSHSEFAASLCQVGTFLLGAGHFADAEASFTEALATLRASVGDGHRDYAASLKGLIRVRLALGRPAEARAFVRELTALDDRRVGEISYLGSELQREAYFETVQDNMDLHLSVSAEMLADEPEAAREALDLVLRRKALGAEAILAQSDARLDGRYPELEPQLQQHSALRMRIATALWSGPRGQTLAEHQQQVDDWTAEKSRVEEALARKIPELNRELRLREVDSTRVAENLPRDTALIEFIRFRREHRGHEASRSPLSRPPAVYAAFVLSGHPDNPVRMLELGRADEIDALVTRFRAAVTNEPAPSAASVTTAAAPGASLREKVIDPVVNVAGGITSFQLAPDGDLTLLPFEVLPLDEHRCVIDAFHVSYLSTGRDVLRFRATVARPPSPPIVLSDPDFDLGHGQAGPRTAASRSRHPAEVRMENWHFSRLPGTRDEGQRIAAELGVAPWLGEAALERRLKSCRGPWVLHLATHGFFLHDKVAASNWRVRDLGADGAKSAEGLRIGRLDNPLLRSGLVLSGANVWLAGGTPPAEAEDGLLTAEDVACLDLAGTELVVLSACETGLGEIRRGEGVLGLRRAFVLAGARTVVMSLWKVPDLATAVLMERFYDNLLRRRMPRSEGLREAQLFLRDLTVGEIRQTWLAPTVISRLSAGNAQMERELFEWAARPDESRLFSAPVNWGAFICQGVGGAMPDRPPFGAPDPDIIAAARPTPLSEAVARYERGDLDVALSLFQAEEARCRRAPDRRGLGDALRYQARILVDRGDWSVGVPLLHDAEKEYRRLGDEAGLAVVQLLRADVLSVTGRRTSKVFGRADREFLTLAEEARDTLERLKCSHEMRWAEQVIAKIRQRIDLRDSL